MAEVGDKELRRRERKRLRIAAHQAHPFGMPRPMAPDELVFDDAAPSKNAIVVLPGREGKLGGSPAVTVFAALEGLPLRRVYVRDLVAVPNHPWGQDLPAVSASLQGVLAGAERRIFLGTSLGGYLALLLGTLAAADHVIVVNPTTRIGGLDVGKPDDDRWPEVMELLAPEAAAGVRDIRELWVAHRAPTVDLHFSSRNEVHRAHAEHLAPCPSVQLHAHDEFLPLLKIRDDGTLRRQVDEQLARSRS